MKGKYLFHILLTILLLVNCIEDRPELKNEGLILNTEIQEPEIFKTQFVEQDAIGIYLVRYTGGSPGILGNISDAETSNKRYTLSSNSFWYADDGNEIYFDTTSDLYIYYPYDEEMSRVPGKRNLTAYPFQIESDQSVSFEEYDFLWTRVQGLTVTNYRISASLNHLMGMMEINIRFDNGDTNINPDLIIHNIETLASINLRNGTAISAGNTQEVNPYINQTITPGYDVTYNAILPPQTITAGTPLISLYSNNDRLLYITETNVEIIAGASLTLNLAVTYQPVTRGKHIPVITLEKE